jgi:phage replication initiation protein
MGPHGELTTAPIVLHFETGQIRPETEGVQAFQVQPQAGPGTPGQSGEGGGESAPPPSNTGAQNTEGEKAGVSIDWFQGTFKTLEITQVLELFTAELGSLADWQALKCGRYGYRHGLGRGAVRVYCDGAEGMGVHVVASGEGCRQLEAEGIVKRWDGPEGFAAQCVTGGFKPSRVDVAMDDHAGLVTQERVEGAIAAGGCVSRFDKGRPYQDVNLADGSRCGWSFRFGSAQSDALVRIYDKYAEQREKGREVEPGPWMRVELQLRNERAGELIARLIEPGAELGKLGAGRLWAYVDFRVVDSVDTNKSRWASCTWWSEFLGNVEKVRWKPDVVVRTLERTAAWFWRQVAPSYALLRFSLEHGQTWLDEAFGSGAERLPDWVFGVLSTQNGLKPASSR